MLCIACVQVWGRLFSLSSDRGRPGFFYFVAAALYLLQRKILLAAHPFCIGTLCCFECCSRFLFIGPGTLSSWASRGLQMCLHRSENLARPSSDVIIRPECILSFCHWSTAISPLTEVAINHYATAASLPTSVIHTISLAWLPSIPVTCNPTSINCAPVTMAATSRLQLPVLTTKGWGRLTTKGWGRCWPGGIATRETAGGRYAV